MNPEELREIVFEAIRDWLDTEDYRHVAMDGQTCMWLAFAIVDKIEREKQEHERHN